MIRNFIILIVFSIFLNVNYAFASSLDIFAKNAVLIDAHTGKVLYEKNADKLAYPASTTKILTMLTALEHNTKGQLVTISKKAADTEGSTANILVGEQYSLTELFYGLMLQSGNDAAVAIAEHIGGNENTFVTLMNEKAKIIGTNQSHFLNASGLPNNNHYTTAKDMALIARYAMTNSLFREIVATNAKSWQVRNQYQKNQIENTNKLLVTYSGATGIKTGSTNQAGRCLVSSAKKDGIELIAVVFASNEANVFEDSKKILDYGFSIAEPKVVFKKDDLIKLMSVSKSRKKVPVIVKQDVVLAITDDFDKYKIEIITDKNLPKQIGDNQKAGVIKIFYDGLQIQEVDLYTKIEDKRTSWLSDWFFG